MNYKEKLLAAATKACHTQYSDYSSLWNHLDNKAQFIVAAAGTFLAASFAYLTEHLQSLTEAERLWLGLVVFLCMVATGTALGSLWLRRTDPPPLGDFHREAIDDMLQVAEADQESQSIQHLIDELDEWGRSTESIFSNLGSKTKWLTASQLALGLALLCIAGGTFLKLLCDKGVAG